MKEIKYLIKNYLTRRQVTLDELAQAIGITTRTIQNYFNKPGSWRLEDLNRVYNFLRVPKGERIYE